MANQREDGTWQAFDGSIHYTEAEAHKANHGGDGSSGAIGTGMPFIIMLFLIGPVILAKLISFVFGLFFNLGATGRVIQSVIVGLVIGWIPALILGGIITEYTPFMGVVGVAVSCALTSLWYFYFLYPVWFYAYADGVFSGLLTKTFGFVWFGGIAIVIFQAIQKFSNEKAMILFGLSFVAAFIYYIIKTRPYAREAKRNKMPLSPVAMIITVAIVCALSGWVAEYNFKSSDYDRIKPGSPAIAEGDIAKLYADADDKSPVIKRLERGDRLTLTGEKKLYRKGRYYFEAEIDGLKGWFNIGVALIIGTATVISDDAEFIYLSSSDRDKKGNVFPQRSALLDKGETFEVVYTKRNAVYGYYKDRKGWIYEEKVQVEMND